MLRSFLHSKRIPFLLGLLLLLFIPLYPKFPLVNIQGTFVAIRIEDLLIASVGIIWGIETLLSRRFKKVVTDPLNLSLLLFWGIGFVSLMSSVFITHTVLPHLGALHLLRRVEFMLLLPIGYWAINSKRQIKSILWSLIFATIVICIYGLGQQYLDWPVVSTTNSEFSKGLILRLTPDARVNSTFAGHYDLAVFLMMILIIIASTFFIMGKRYKLISLGLVGLSSFVLILTAARLSFVAVVFGVILSLILTGKKWIVLVVILMAVAAVLYPSQLRDRLISTITVNIKGGGERYVSQNQNQSSRSRLNIPTLQTKPVIKPGTNSSNASGSGFLSASEAGELASDIAPGEPTDSTELGVYRSFNIRTNQEWPRAIRAFIKNPALGTGYSSIGVATDNDILRSLGEVGLLGSLALALVIVIVLKRIYQNYRSSDRFIQYLSAGMISVVIAFLMNATFIDVFESSKVASVFWLLLGITIASEKL